MYNSQNLPLSKKKIIKKTLDSGGMLPMIILLVLFPIISYMGGRLDLHIGNQAAVYVFLAFFVPSFLILLISLGYQYLYYKFYFYNFEEDTAEIRKGVVSNATGHVRYVKIQNILVDQDFLDRIFGLYDVHYETAGESSSFYSHIDGLEKENADKLVAFLKERIKSKDYKSSIMPGVEIKNEKLESINESELKVFTRENMPVEKRVVLANAIMKTILNSIMIILISGYALNSVSDELGIPISVFGYIILIVPIISFILSFIWESVWYRNYYFKFDGQGGLITEKVLSASTTNVYFNRVQNINISQSIIERMTGLYEVTMETAAEGAGSGTVTITGLKRENADILRDFLLEKTKKYQSI